MKALAISRFPGQAASDSQRVPPPDTLTRCIYNGDALRVSETGSKQIERKRRHLYVILIVCWQRRSASDERGKRERKKDVVTAVLFIHQPRAATPVRFLNDPVAVERERLGGEGQRNRAREGG